MTTLQRKTINPHARLVALAAGLRTGTIDTAERERLADRLERIAAGEDARDVLGVARARGQRLWTTSAALAERNRLLCEAATQFFAALPMVGQAQAIHLELVRYRQSGWQYERSAEECPSRHVGRLREQLWRILRTHDCLPSVRTIRAILATS